MFNSLKLQALTIIAVLALSFPPSLFADPILTFEGFSDLTVITNQYPRVVFNGATILTAGISLNEIDFPPHTGVNVIINSVGPMELVFSSSINYFSGYLTYNNGMTVEGYDVLNNLLDTAIGAFSANFVSSGNPPNEYLRIDASGITRVVLTGGGSNSFVLDDAQFTGSVPEPSTFFLLGAGLGGLALIRRKARKQ